MVIKFKNKKPFVKRAAFIAENATIIGDVNLDENTSVWYNAVLRADSDKITVGKGSNIQDNVTIHCDKKFPVNIGNNVTIGHNAILHGCTIGNNTLIGMGAIIMNGAVIGDNTVVAAGSIIPEGRMFPNNALLQGTPATVVRELSDDVIDFLHSSASAYVKLAKVYSSDDNNVESGVDDAGIHRFDNLDKPARSVRYTR